MHAEEALGGSGRSGPLHLALSSPYRLMRVLPPDYYSEAPVRADSSVVSAGTRKHRTQLVGHQQFRRKPLLSEKLAIRRNAARVSRRRSPACREPRLRDRQHARGTSACRRSGRPSRPDAIDRSGEGGPAARWRSPVRTSAPAPGRFRRRCRAHAQEEILDVLVAEREAQVEPDRMLDDDRREPVATV